MEKNLGHATAYGYAKSKGYSGTEDEFAQLMADYASVGQSAAQSAEQAASSATSASASAQTASQAAQTATSKASEAVTAAGTATTKASEASQSASTASAAATSAITSAQTATTAASTATTEASEAAVSANTATTAKTDAESARDAAAQSASEAAASAESIDPDEFNRKIYAAFATDTATGDIASFVDGADNIPMKDVLVHIEPVQAGSGDPSPENVRPITGWTGCEVQRTGVNVWDEEWEVGVINNDGSISTSSTSTSRRTTSFISVVGGAEYCLSTPYPNSGRGAFYDAGKNLIEYYYDFPTTIVTEVGGGRYKTVFDTPNNARYFRYTLAEHYGATYKNDISINYPSTDHDYHPYVGQTYPITFPVEAGGGELDVTNGTLTVDRAMRTFDGSENWDLQSINSYGIANFIITIDDAVTGKSNPCINNRFPLQVSLISKTETEGLYLNDNGSLFVRIKSATASTVAEFKEWLASNNLELCYELATPITLTLSPTEIKTLLGVNNIWADTGDSTVIYRADTTMYINRKIAEAVSALS